MVKQKIAIIGAGPSGCAAAKSLLLSHMQSDQSSSKYAIQFFFCNKKKINIGETIPPAATPVLHELQFSHVLASEQKSEQLSTDSASADFLKKSRQPSHLKCPGSISMWGSNKAGFNDFYFNPEGQGYHLNRSLFESDLIKNVHESSNGGDVSFYSNHRLVNVIKNNDKKYQLFFLVDGKYQKSYVADFVIDASGSASVFARRIGVAKNILDEVLSLNVIVDYPIASDIGDYTLVEAVANGWWYAAKLPNNKLIISFCSDHSVIQSQSLQSVKNWLYALANTQLLKQKIDLSAIHNNLTIHSRIATSKIMSRVVGEGWLAVGDAASSYDSISSAGITKALKNGLDAGKALYQFIEYENEQAIMQYEKSVFKDFSQYLKLRHDIYRSEPRFQLEPFWLHRRGLV